jgi:hypothetical protein
VAVVVVGTQAVVVELVVLRLQHLFQHLLPRMQFL